MVEPLLHAELIIHTTRILEELGSGPSSSTTFSAAMAVASVECPEASGFGKDHNSGSRWVNDD